MSQKIPINMSAIGEIDTDTNPLALPPGTARLLHNLGDLYNERKLSLQPGYKNLYSAPVMAGCTVGTVAVSNGSATVTGTSTTWITHATHSERPNPGDFFRGPDGKFYVIKSIETDTSLTLESKYEGTTDASSTVDPITDWTATSAAIIHKVWLLHQFYSEAGDAGFEAEVSLTGGTHTNTEVVDGTIMLGKAHDVTSSSSNGSIAATEGNPTLARSVNRATGSGNNYNAYWSRAYGFTVSGTAGVDDLTVNGLWVRTLVNTEAGEDVSCAIVNDNAGQPTGSTVANSSADIIGPFNDSSLKNFYWVAYSSSVTLVAGSKYWIKVSSQGDWETDASDSAIFFGSQDTGTEEYPHYALLNWWNGQYWSNFTTSGAQAWWHLGEYLQTAKAENNWVSETIDVGYTPVEDGTLSIGRTFDIVSADKADNFWNSQDTSDTFEWDLERSATGAWGGEEATVASGQTALTYTIASGDYARYYRLTLYMSSNDGRSSPKISDINIVFPALAENTGTALDNGGRSFIVTGSGNTLFKDAKPSSANTLLQPFTNSGQGEATAWQRKLFITTGNTDIKYWDGVSALKNVNDLLKSDGTAGDDPVDRAQRLLLHNDRMFYYKNVERDLVTGASTTLAATRLTSTSADWTGYEDNELISFRVYPNTNGATGNPYPLKWYTITDNDKDNKYVDASGVDMTTYATVADAFRVARNYDATSWYSGQDEPADNSTTDLLIFGEDSGDDFQAMVSWKRRAYAIMENSVWRVVGYGPSTPWEKSQVSKGIGTMSPYSVIVAGDVMFWWAPEGIVAYQGGYNQPEIISGTLKALVKDGINTDAIHHITGIFHDGLCYWSYPATGSNINNRTMVYNPSTGRLCIRTFGMYTPMIYTDDKGNTAMYFFEPTSGLIQEYDTGYTFDGVAQDAEVRIAHVMGGSPHTDSHWQKLLAVVVSDGDASVGVELAKDYSTTYTSEGTLIPWNTDITSRTGVSSSDVAYLNEFAMDSTRQTISPAVSLKLTATLSDKFEIRFLELVCDPVDVRKYEEV